MKKLKKIHIIGFIFVLTIFLAGCSKQEKITYRRNDDYQIILTVVEENDIKFVREVEIDWKILEDRDLEKLEKDGVEYFDRLGYKEGKDYILNVNRSEVVLKSKGKLTPKFLEDFDVVTSEIEDTRLSSVEDNFRPYFERIE